MFMMPRDLDFSFVGTMFQKIVGYGSGSGSKVGRTEIDLLDLNGRLSPIAWPLIVNFLGFTVISAILLLLADLDLRVEYKLVVD